MYTKYLEKMDIQRYGNGIVSGNSYRTFESVVPSYVELRGEDNNIAKASSPFDYFQSLRGLMAELPNGAEPLSDVLRERLALKKFTLGQIMALIQGRRKIMYRHIKEIDRGVCNCISHIYELEFWLPQDRARRQNTLERTIAGLEKEKRAERVACWRDLARLHQDVLEAIGEYRSAKRRARLFAPPYENG